MTDARRARGRAPSGVIALTSTLVGVALLGATSLAVRSAPSVAGPRHAALGGGQSLWRAPGAPASEWGLRPAVTSPTHLSRVEGAGDASAAGPTALLLALAPAPLGLEPPGAVELLRSRLRVRAPRPAAPRIPSARAPPR